MTRFSILSLAVFGLVRVSSLQGAPDFSITPSTRAITLAPGAATNITVQVGAQGGFQGIVE
ncbi:MAG: hypothetical protein ACRD8O_02770, partial [Bryobacteraceae bacterium]